MNDRANIVIERTYAAEPEELWGLWTTKAGFESWWGPQGFRSDVHKIEARQDGALHYDMVADAPEVVAEMAKLDRPPSHGIRGTFSEFKPHERLVLSQIIDFLPGVEPYNSTIEVEFFPAGEGHVRMVVTLWPMHDAETSAMQKEGFLSQLSKLDERYGWQG